MEIPFVKMHGLGNDYIYVDLFANPQLQDADWPAISRGLSDRHRGVGGDGIILIMPPSAPWAAVRMRIFNADGSEGEMCGNGVRCLARYAQARDYAPAAMRVETLGGPRLAVVQADGSVRVEMGRPRFGPQDLGFAVADEMIDRPFEIAGDVVRLTAVSMGNPHVVSFWPAGTDLEAVARRLGPPLERASFAPRRTNVGFAVQEAPDRLRLVVWERGSGLTQACGTGACAALAAAVRGGLGARAAQVRLPGGALHIHWPADGEQVQMTGPAQWSFRGSCNWPPDEEEF